MEKLNFQNLSQRVLNPSTISLPSLPPKAQSTGITFTATYRDAATTVSTQ